MRYRKTKQAENDVSKSECTAKWIQEHTAAGWAHWHIEGTVDHYNLLFSRLRGFAILKKKPVQTERKPTVLQQKNNVRGKT